MRYLLVVIPCFLCFTASAQLRAYNFNQLDSLKKKENKPVMVFIYTDWCNFCNAMKQTTFKQKAIIKLLTNDFYFVTLNGESKEPIYYGGKHFKYNVNQGLHNLVVELANVNGKIAYPTTIVLNKRGEQIFMRQEFISAEQLITVLNKLPHN